MFWGILAATMSREFYKGLGEKETWPKITGVNPMALTYDNVLIAQKKSDVESRSEIDLSTHFGPYHLSLPLISAPMDTITGEEMARKLAEMGGIGAIPRGNVQESLRICETFSEENIPAIYAVGLKNGFEHARKLKERGAEIILVDVANGAQEGVKKLASEIKDKLDVTIMAGNITDYENAKDYQQYGIDIARVGVGGGGLCTTRLKTGVGMPQLSAVFDTVAAGIDVVADGGVRYPGDVAKALAAGAKAVMIGSLLGGSDEAPGDRVEIGGRMMKEVRGQASAKYMEANRIAPSRHRTEEGIATLVETSGPVKDKIDDIRGGVKSSFSYTGSRNLGEFYANSQFIIVSDATQRENKPHIIFGKNI